MIPRRGVKIKIFLSVVIYVVKGDFVPLSAIGENPANAGVARLCGVGPYPVPDTDTALPNQARYQLRYTRICTFRCGSMRLHTFCTHANLKEQRRFLPHPFSAIALSSRVRFLTAQAANPYILQFA